MGLCGMWVVVGGVWTADSNPQLFCAITISTSRRNKILVTSAIHEFATRAQHLRNFLRSYINLTKITYLRKI